MANYEIPLIATVECADDADADRQRSELQRLIEKPPYGPMIAGFVKSKVTLVSPLKLGRPVKK